MLPGEVVALTHGRRRPGNGLQGPGLVVHVADLEDRRAVAGYQDGSPGLQAGEHALLPVRDDVARSVDHREVDDGRRKALVDVGMPQQVLTEEFVAAVLDLGVAAFRGMVLGDGQMIGRRVDHRRAGEHVLASPPSEDLHHESDVVRVVGAHVHHDVVLAATQDLAHLVVVGPVGEEAVEAVRQRRLGLAPVHDGDLVSAADQLVYQRQSVELRAAHDEHVHEITPEGETDGPAGRGAVTCPARSTGGGAIT